MDHFEHYFTQIFGKLTWNMMLSHGSDNQDRLILHNYGPTGLNKTSGVS